MTVLHYDLERVLALRRRARDALAALDIVASRDPAAADAVAAARRAAANLADRWMPVLERLAASEAMLGWHAAGPLVPPDAAARALAALALGIDDDEIDDMLALRAALEAGRGDPAALARFFDALGGAETARLLMRLGTIGDDTASEAALALAATVRSALATASPRLDGRFARAMVAAFVDAVDDDERNPAVALSYLLHGAAFDTTFVVALTRELVRRELAAGEGDATGGFLLWPWAPAGGPPSTLYRDFGDDEPTEEFFLAGDPMYAVLDALARDGAAARTVLVDATVGAYLLRDRPLAQDGLRRLAATGVAAAAGPDVVATADPAVLRSAARAASAFVNLFAERGADALWWQAANDEVSQAAATILGRHLPAVHFAILHGGPMASPHGELVPLVDAARGTTAGPEGALFDIDALDLLSALAVDTDDGTATVRAALDLYQADRAAATVQQLRVDGAGADALLREAVADAARLEAHFIEHAGHRAEARGRSRDVLTSFWIDMATFSIGQSSSAASIELPMISEALGPAADVAKRLLADHEATAARDATANAEAAADQLAYVWYRALYRGGVITPALPATAVDQLGLVSWEEFQQLRDRDRAIVRSRMEETTGLHGINLDGGALRDVIKVQQLPIYRELD